MAEIQRIPKSAQRWEANDLLAFNIHTVPEDTATFFGGDPNLPEPTVDPAFLEHVERPPGPLLGDTAMVFGSLRALLNEKEPSEGSITDFTQHLLSMLNYGVPGRLLKRRRGILFQVCGKTVRAEPKISFMALNRGCDLLVHTVEPTSTLNPEPRLIAEAIAAFSDWQDIQQAAGQELLRHKEIAGIIMRGTAPTFYKIVVTKELLQSVGDATYPDQPTFVHKLRPPVHDIAKYFKEGLQTLDNRRVIMQCFEAFKRCLPYDR
ncbi:hypothetical protein BDN72DRAFT_837511 [Pluteus cervinus]|uniref:Uncharacterized protein n=1 Tax=Pluteus cervinus TaxID=181527 RepID=A0ACD3B1G6_9AGAR|nr:hypothetical protein BDN72DRAFT_837511 [Pluteus cervinus]